MDKYILDFLLYDTTENSFITIEDYAETTVKGVYDKLPKIKYPLVTIQEIQNSEDYKYTDRDGEHISNLAYQVECLSRNIKNVQAADSAMFMGIIVNDLLKGPNYKMRRIGSPVTQTLINDNEVVRYIQRYSCSLNLDTNTIYSRS